MINIAPPVLVKDINKLKVMNEHKNACHLVHANISLFY